MRIAVGVPIAEHPRHWPSANPSYGFNCLFFWFRAFVFRRRAQLIQLVDVAFAVADMVEAFWLSKAFNRLANVIER